MVKGLYYIHNNISAREQYMNYTIYKTTNLINNKIYIGQHQTNNLNDNYLGSGTLLLFAIKKYGKENFSKEILYNFDNFKDMNDKETELVTSEFVSLDTTYNLTEGGLGNTASLTSNKVHIFDEDLNKYIRIDLKDFDKNIHKTANKNKLLIKTKEGFVFIESKDYDPEIHETASKGLVSVECLATGKTSSVKLSEFNPTTHKKVFGGIVANGRYVSKEEYYSDPNLVTHTANHVTIKLEDGTCKRIPCEEYDKKIHVTPSSSLVIAILKSTNEKVNITSEEYKINKHLYKTFSTGQKTVYDMETKSFMNINKEDFDRTIHKLPSDKKFKVYNKDKEMILDYWGTKKDFFKDHCNTKNNEKLWKCIINEGTYIAHKNKGLIKDPQFDKCYFILEEFK